MLWECAAGNFCLILPVNNFMSSRYITNVGSGAWGDREGIPGHHLHRPAGAQGLRLLLALTAHKFNLNHTYVGHECPDCRFPLRI